MLPPSSAADMEAESRNWLVRCGRCGHERSVWDMGRVRYRAHYTTYTLRRCEQCGKRTPHRVHWRNDSDADMHRSMLLAICAALFLAIMCALWVAVFMSGF